MYKNEIVSVIIPVYNVEDYLFETLTSVINQTYKNIEIILVDDSSTDKSIDIIKGFNDSRIVLLTNEVNSGAAVSRNKALMAAIGRYVAFLDSDDIWNNDKIEKQLSFMKERGIAFSFTTYSMFLNSGEIITEKIRIKNIINYKDMLCSTYISTPTVMIDRHSLGQVQMPLRRRGQDYAFWLQLLRNGINAYGLDEPLTKVRRRRDSLSGQKFGNLKVVWEVQIINERLSTLRATLNTIAYAIFALKKRYLSNFYQKKEKEMM